MAINFGQKLNADYGIKIGTSSTAGHIFTASDTSGNGSFAAPAAQVFYTGHTFAIPDAVHVPSGDIDYIPGIFIPEVSGQVTEIALVRYRINSGTSATVKLQNNGGDVTGFTGISVTTTSATTNPTDVSVTDLDYLTLVVTAVSGSPKNLSFTVVLEHTVS
jgi:hypothetical protein